MMIRERPGKGGTTVQLIRVSWDKDRKRSSSDEVCSGRLTGKHPSCRGLNQRAHVLLVQCAAQYQPISFVQTEVDR